MKDEGNSEGWVEVTGVIYFVQGKRDPYTVCDVHRIDVNHLSINRAVN